MNDGKKVIYLDTPEGRRAALLATDLAAAELRMTAKPGDLEMVIDSGPTDPEERRKWKARKYFKSYGGEPK